MYIHVAVTLFTCDVRVKRGCFTARVHSPLQPDMYPRMHPAPGYDSIPHYPGTPSYGTSMHYPGQYPYGSPRSVGPPGMTGPGGMVGHMMDGYPEGMRGAGGGGTQGMGSSGSGGVMSYPSGGAHWTADPTRRPSMPPGMNRGWNQVKGSCSHLGHGAKLFRRIFRLFYICQSVFGTVHVAAVTTQHLPNRKLVVQ